MRRVISTLLIGFALAGEGAPVPGFGTAELGHPALTGEGLRAVAWGEPGCVAVGDDGEILFSADGRDWRRVESPVGPSDSPYVRLSEATYGAGCFVVTGGIHGQGLVLRSTDGENWELVRADLPQPPTDLLFADGRFVSVEGTRLNSSPDGRTWTTLPEPPALKGLAFGGGVWVGISGGGRYYRSLDLESWVPTGGSDFGGIIIPDDYAQSSICHAAGRFVVTGGYHSQGSGTSASVIKWSADGIQWSDGSGEEETMWGVQTDCAAAGSGTLICVGARTPSGGHRSIWLSEDGALWTRATVDLGPRTVTGSLTSVAGWPGRPSVAVSGAGEIVVSDGGLEWNLAKPAAREWMRGVSYSDRRFVATAGRSSSIGGPSGACAIFSSEDGLAWTTFLPERTQALSAVAHGAGRWVVTGDAGGIFTSEDGVAWTDRSLPATNDRLDVLAHGNGRFVTFARFRDRIHHSPDGLSWETVDGPPVADVNAAGFFDGRFVAVGSDGYVATSEDGLAWTVTRLDPALEFLGIAYGKGRYIISSHDHLVVTTDVENFRVIESDLAPKGVTYIDGWFVSDEFRVSRDGINWRAASKPVPRSYRADSLAIGRGMMVASVGLELWRFPFEGGSFAGAAVFPGVGVELESKDGFEYRLRESTHLGGWTPSGGWRAGDGDFLLWETDFSGPARFWSVESRSAP